MANPRDQIITLPNTHLRQRSKKVGIITKAVKKTIDDMQAALMDWEASREHEVGVALAAVQIDHLIRIVIIRNDFNNKEDRSYRVLINPLITKYEGEIQEDYEGCLSIKDIYGRVPRYAKVRVRAINEDGKEIRIKADGFLARTLQHEIDHTNGVVFIDHIHEKADAFFRLNSEGDLEQLDYEKDIKDDSILWE